MSLTPYVHVDEPIATATAGHAIGLSKDDLHHLTRVLRLSDGASIEVADGVGAHAPARLVSGAVELTANPDVQPRPTPAILVAQALNKGRKFDDMLRQVAELGADVVVPLRAERSVVKLDDAKAERAVQRWQAVARATAEQSRQPFRLHVTSVTDIEALGSALDAHVVRADSNAADSDAGLSDVAEPRAAADGAGADNETHGSLSNSGDLQAGAEVDGDVRVVAVPGAPALPTQLRPVIGRVQQVTVAVGPEGGFSERDLAELAEARFIPVGLGPTVLRTEHAAPTAVAVLAALLGRW